MSAPKNFGMYLQVYFLLVSYIPRGSRAVPFQVDGTHTHTHPGNLSFSLYNFFFLFCFVYFPFFLCKLYGEKKGSPGWIGSAGFIIAYYMWEKEA